jgi:hypothetical protein
LVLEISPHPKQISLHFNVTNLVPENLLWNCWRIWQSVLLLLLLPSVQLFFIFFSQLWWLDQVCYDAIRYLLTIYLPVI